MPAATLARLVLLEARRGGLPWLALACVALSVGLAGFLSAVAITESGALQLALVAAVLRACAVFLLVAHVAGSTLREQNDKGLEIMLALPLPRRTHYLGRLAGFAAAGAALAAVFSAPLLLWAPPEAVAFWAVSLAAECALMAAAALFFAMTLAQLVPAIAATIGTYLLARSMATIQAIAGGPLTEPSPASRAMGWIVDAVALLLPPVEGVARTEWLLYGPPPAGAFAAALGGLAVYGALVIAAGLFDFYRKSV